MYTHVAGVSAPSLHGLAQAQHVLTLQHEMLWNAETSHTLQSLYVIETTAADHEYLAISKDRKHAHTICLHELVPLCTI